jgi:hypothetical protein
MNSYIVRIYRKAENNPRVLVGVVEEIGAKGKKAFTNLYELWEILNPERKGGNHPGNARDRMRKESDAEGTNQ